ncbi:hypothetical protein V6N13_083458 [Hibiscus sabdariffa]
MDTFKFSENRGGSDGEEVSVSRVMEEHNNWVGPRWADVVAMTDKNVSRSKVDVENITTVESKEVSEEAENIMGRNKVLDQEFSYLRPYCDPWATEVNKNFRKNMGADVEPSEAQSEEESDKGFFY